MSLPDPLCADAPLLEAWHSASRRVATPFTIPGHKRAADSLSPTLGDVLRSDVPLYGGLDTVKLSTGVLAEAEAMAAALWGADWCRFSTGGSTHANQALTLGVGRPGDTVLVVRSAHRSTLLALVMAGLTPAWLPTSLDPRFGIPLGVSESALRRGLRDHPGARAVLLVEPSYLGTVSELDNLTEIAHDAGCAVLVDQAWGAHFGFHPSFPPHALRRGADAFVASAHKTLPAYSQASMVFARRGMLDLDRLERAFEAGHTTSPAGSILASIDGARSLLAQRGKELLQSLAEMVSEARQKLRAIPGVQVPGPEDFPAGRFDPAKLVVLVAGTGASGVDIEQDLSRAGISVELADQDTVVPLVTIADSPAAIARLVDALSSAIERRRSRPRPLRTAPEWHAGAIAAMTPRDAFFADHVTVPAADAVGRVSAELVAPYPPGVPALVPGEIITAEALDSLRAAQKSGTRVAYAADPTLTTFQVVSG